MTAQSAFEFAETGESAIEGFEPFRGRQAPKIGQRCRVYRNLNRPSRFSIMSWEGETKGLVLGYGRAVGLSAVVLKVQAGGLERARKTGTRNVHALADGFLVGIAKVPPANGNGRNITYCPFDHQREGRAIRGGYFYDRADPQTRVEKLSLAWAYGSNLVAPYSAIEV